LKLDKKKIEKIKTENGFPINSVFMGYILYFPDNDEYLVYYDNDEFVMNCGYGQELCMAFVFKNYNRARNAAKDIKYKSVISLFFKLDDSCYVSHLDIVNFS